MPLHSLKAHTQLNRQPSWGPAENYFSKDKLCETTGQTTEY